MIIRPGPARPDPTRIDSDYPARGRGGGGGAGGGRRGVPDARVRGEILREVGGARGGGGAGLSGRMPRAGTFEAELRGVVPDSDEAPPGPTSAR